MLRLVLAYLSRPLTRWLLRTAPVADPWERFPASVPLRRFGLGARRAFRWYFEGQSAVEVRSVEQVQDWLLACTYVRDPVLFREDDFWQHPCTFEQLRRGDCEDFCLWAWRKLVRLGYDAEFVAGRCLAPGCSPAGHTWILFRQRGRVFLFDPVMRRRNEMIRSLDDVRHEYLPEVSVDGGFRRYVYAGYYLRRAGRMPAPETRHAPMALPQSA